MSDLDFLLLLKDSKSIGDICREQGIDYSNMLKGSTTKENIKIVANKYKNEIKKMYSLVKFVEEENKKIE